MNATTLAPAGGFTFSEHIINTVCFFVCTIMAALRSEHLAFDWKIPTSVQHLCFNDLHSTVLSFSVSYKEA